MEPSGHQSIVTVLDRPGEGLDGFPNDLDFLERFLKCREYGASVGTDVHGCWGKHGEEDKSASLNRKRRSRAAFSR